MWPYICIVTVQRDRSLGSIVLHDRCGSLGDTNTFNSLKRSTSHVARQIFCPAFDFDSCEIKCIV